MAQHARLAPLIQAINCRLSSREVWALHKVYCATSGSVAYAKISSASPGARARNMRRVVSSCGTGGGVVALLMCLSCCVVRCFYVVPRFWKPNAVAQARLKAGATEERTL